MHKADVRQCNWKDLFTVFGHVLAIKPVQSANFTNINEALQQHYKNIQPWDEVVEHLYQCGNKSAA